tara:strand:- start:102 stop:767 length:666 start_codon:yes stop_codon:yes gene_type:complete
MTFSFNKFVEISDFLAENKDLEKNNKNVSIIAITKNHSKDTILEAIKNGVKVFGENRVQEALSKYLELKSKYHDLELHLVGPLQTNKVKKAIMLFDFFHTLDRESLAKEFVKQLGKSLNKKKFFIQINVGIENQKSGLKPKDADDFIRYCVDELKIKVLGLMCIPPIDLNPQPFFIELRDIAYRNNLKFLSMGMSSDYKIAVTCGATHIRIGSMLFGERDK